MKKLFYFCLLFCFTISMYAQDATKDTATGRIRIGFAQFTDKTKTFSSSTSVRNSSISYQTETQIAFDLENFANMLQTALVKTRRFEVIERAALDKILEEQGLSQAGIVNPDTAGASGFIRGVDYLLIGTVTKCGMVRNPKRVGKYEQMETTIELGIDFRLTDVMTGRIVLSDFVEVNDKALSAVSGGNYSSVSSTDNYVENVTRKATLQAAFLIANAIDPVKIIDVNLAKKIVKINYGNGFIEANQIYRIFPDSESGDSWDAGFDEIGKVKIKTVTPQYTIAEIVEGDVSSFTIGCVCQKITPDEEQKYLNAEKLKTRDPLGDRFGY